ncbi:MAG: hypothetical protein V1796_00610, partial [Pseudomonadota bacterium]
MRWVAPTEKDSANKTLEKRLWAAADQFRANSGLKAAPYSAPVLGLMARTLYREWFVHFRFPGHEKLPRVASPIGAIPQGCLSVFSRT